MSIGLLLLALTMGAAGSPVTNYPVPTAGDYTIHDFHFRDGESLPEVHMHYLYAPKPYGVTVTCASSVTPF